ncbi:MAG: FtsX-like permease family protein [Gemmatimonadales bacterium]
MFSPRWRKVLRDVVAHRARMLLVVPAIAVGLVAAGAVLNTWALVERATRLGYAATNPPAATIRTERVDEALLELIRRQSGVADARARRTVGGEVRTSLRSIPLMLFVGDDFAQRRIGLLKPEEGDWPPAAGGLVVERSSVDFAAISVGEAVTVVVGDSAVALPVTGVVRDVGVAPGWMEHVVYAFATPATLARLGLSSDLTEVQLTVFDAGLDQAGVRRLAAGLKTVIEGTGRVVSDVDVPIPGEHIHTGQMNSLLYTQAGFGILALVLSGFLVVNLITAMLTGQVREIGVMKAIGAQPKQLAGMYLVLAAALGVAASLVALPAAALIGRRYGAFKAELLNFEVTGYAIPVWVIVLQAAVGVLVPVLAAAWPVRRGARMPVARALRDFGIEAGGPAVMTRVTGPSRPLLLSLRNAFRQRRRMALTLTTLAMGGGAFLGTQNLRQAIADGLDLNFASRQYDFLIRLVERRSADSLESLVAGVPGVASAEAWTGTGAAVVGRDGLVGNEFNLTAPPADTRLLAVSLRGRWLEPGDDRAIVLSGNLAAREGLKPGDEVTLQIGGREASWLVVGVGGAEIGAGGAWARREVVADLVGGGLVATAAVRAEGRGLATELDLIRRVREALDGAGFDVLATTRTAEARRVTEDHLLTVVDFLGVMAWVLIVVGGLALASTMGLAVLERTREIGVLRAIGARHRHILAIVVAEGLVIGLASWLLAMPLSIPMSVVLEAVFGRVFMTLPPTLVPEARGVALWFGLVVVVSLAASAAPAVRAMRVTTARALAYE